MSLAVLGVSAAVVIKNKSVFEYLFIISCTQKRPGYKIAFMKRFADEEMFLDHDTMDFVQLWDYVQGMRGFDRMFKPDDIVNPDIAIGNFIGIKSNI